METVTPGSSGGHLSAPGGIWRRQHVEGTTVPISWSCKMSREFAWRKGRGVLQPVPGLPGGRQSSVHSAIQQEVSMVLDTDR